MVQRALTNTCYVVWLAIPFYWTISFSLHKYLKNIILGDSSEGMLSVLEKKIQKNNITNMKPLKNTYPQNVYIIYNLESKK